MHRCLCWGCTDEAWGDKYRRSPNTVLSLPGLVLSLLCQEEEEELEAEQENSSLICSGSLLLTSGNRKWDSKSCSLFSEVTWDFPWSGRKSRCFVWNQEAGLQPSDRVPEFLFLLFVQANSAFHINSKMSLAFYKNKYPDRILTTPPSLFESNMANSVLKITGKYITVGNTFR